jgi:hypothetical protein
LVLIILTGIASASNISATTGKTWIEWNWNQSLFNSSYNVSVYVDGVFMLNTTLDYYILDNLNPDEQHRIDVIGINASDYTQTLQLTDSSITKTSIPVWIIFVDLILFLYGLLDHSNRIYGNIAAMFISFILSFLISFSLISGTFIFISSAFSYLFSLIGVIALLYTIAMLIEAIVEVSEEEV